MKSPLLQIDRLNVTFNLYKKKIAAVRDVSFSLYPKETVAIVGESGSGKSVTAKSILRLLPKHTAEIQGSIRFQNRDLLKMSNQGFRHFCGKEIGMVFQDSASSLNPTMKVGKQIVEGYLYHYPEVPTKEAKDYVLELLRLVGIPNPRLCFEEYPHTLSGGMRQRIMIAIALVCKPKLLITDEPTTALDVTIQAQILELLKEIKSRLDTTILMITHDLSLVSGFCDRVLVMYAGEIVENTDVDTLFYAPRHPYTQKLLESIPRLDQSKDEPLNCIEGNPPDLMQPFVGCAFAPRCPNASTLCHKQPPSLKEISDKHQCACWNPIPEKPIQEPYEQSHSTLSHT